jgi:ABC-type lipoprotein release transport system permease subunit
LVSARAVQWLLFDIRPGDPPALTVTCFTLAIAGIVAAYLPARRAASLDPERVLRAE